MLRFFKSAYKNWMLSLLSEPMRLLQPLLEPRSGVSSYAHGNNEQSHKRGRNKTSKESDQLTSFLLFSFYRDGGLVFREAKEIRKRCGKTKPPTVSSSNAVMWIRFIADDKVEKRGFSIKVLPVRGKRNDKVNCRLLTAARFKSFE